MPGDNNRDTEARISQLQRTTIQLQAALEAINGGSSAARVNSVEGTNSAALGPAAGVNYTPGPITKGYSGKMKINVAIQGTLSVPTDVVNINITKDSASIASLTGVGANGAGLFNGGLSFIDTATDGAAHSYGVSLGTSGGNVTVPIGNASVVVVELVA